MPTCKRSARLSRAASPRAGGSGAPASAARELPCGQRIEDGFAGVRRSRSRVASRDDIAPSSRSFVFTGVSNGCFASQGTRNGNTLRASAGNDVAVCVRVPWRFRTLSLTMSGRFPLRFPWEVHGLSNLFDVKLCTESLQKKSWQHRFRQFVCEADLWPARRCAADGRAASPSAGQFCHRRRRPPMRRIAADAEPR